ncbi:MAG: hypothetical protein CL477_19300 [Acidobacteria bacterium]|jgi:DnaJ-domain-containing protein 1|nr:hypothetical protein [Acidobacteriota bacterium]MDP7620052.1 J domain-containing protein [Dehalococcoidia bacterium]|tara:strand:- start:675 stop:1106 length:432 start_codon:yes stop_codon:yes gene_type:complete
MFVTNMSFIGRVGVLLKSELSGRLGARRWGAGVRHSHRRDPSTDREQGRTVGEDTASRPEAAAVGGRGAPSRDPELAEYYANLELSYGADIDAVREARRRLLKRYHPDLHSADPDKKRIATQLAQGLNRAHDELLDRLDRKQR